MLLNIKAIIHTFEYKLQWTEKKMNPQKFILSIVIFTICFVLISCSSHTGNKQHTDKINSDSSATSIQRTNSATTDSLTVQKSELTKIYTQAIAEFIKAVYKKDKSHFDTLYFRKHIYGQSDDIPDIELPKTIENTQIQLVIPEIG